MNKQFYIYVHCRPDGEPFYVGKGHGQRLNKFSTRKQYHKNIVAKLKGRIPWNKGLKTGPHTKEHNEKIRLRNKGKHHAN